MVGSRDKGNDDFAAELKAVLEPLATLGFPVADWTATALNEVPSTIRNFIQNIKMFNRIVDEMVIMDDCLALGIQKGFWTKITSCTIRGMYDFTCFIQSDDGKTLLHDLAKKRAQIDKAYLSLFNLQLLGFALAKKRKRAELKDEFAGPCSIFQWQELEKKIADVDALFLPSSQYQPLDEISLLERCYEKYLAKGMEGMEVLDLEQDLMETLKVKYGVAVRQAHLHEFMRDEGRRNMIKVWANEKIVELGEKKEADIFHHLLETTEEAQPTCTPLLLSPTTEREFFSFDGDKGNDDFAAELKAVLKPLATLGFPVADWTPTALNKGPSAIRNFIQNIKMFNRIEDDMVIKDDCLALGIQKGFWTKITSCIIRGMYDFTRFIQSDDGKILLHDLAKKRAQIDKAYLSLFNLQLLGLALAKKRKRAELEDEIVGSRRYLPARLKHELEKKVADVDALFLPSSQYQPLDEISLLERCYEKYLAKAIEQGMEVLDLKQDLMETLKVKYEVVVRTAHFHEFMRDEGRRNMIKVWANENIVELGERKEADIFHHLLETTGHCPTSPVQNAEIPADTSSATFGFEGESEDKYQN